MSGLSIRGGAGGVQADLADQRRWAGMLDQCGDTVRSAAMHASDRRDAELLLRTAVWSPGTAVVSGLQLADGVTRVIALAVRIEAQAQVLRTTAALTEAADVLPGQLTHALQRELGWFGTAAVLADGMGQFLLSTPGVAWDAAVDPDLTLQEAALDRLADIGTDILHDSPWAVDMVVNTLSEVPDDLAGLLLGVEPGLTNEEAAALLVHVLTGTGVMADTPVTLSTYDGPVPPAPRDPLELVDNLRTLRESAIADDEDPDDAVDESLLGLTRVETEAGGTAWIIQIPGTQRLALQGENPADFATNLALMADQDAALLSATRQMMREAGVGPGEPIMTAGHSQGGMAATRLAEQLTSDGYDVTHTLTLGSPVAGMPVPTTVQALSVEHHQDVVPRLDGRPNPGGINRTTVSADAPDAAPDTAIGPHSIDAYRITLETALDGNHDSVTEWAQGTTTFFAEGGTTTWYEVSR